MLDSAKIETHYWWQKKLSKTAYRPYAALCSFCHQVFNEIDSVGCINIVLIIPKTERSKTSARFSRNRDPLLVAEKTE